MGAFSETFSPLKNRNLRLYLSGQAISLIGTWMQITAQSWVVWQLSKSEAALGLVGMMGSLPLLVLGPIAGVWADRLDRRKILINTQTVAMILAMILAVLVQFHWVQLWHVYILAFTLGCVSALDMPSQQAFIGDMVGMEQIRKAVVVNSMIVQVSRILGPTLAGLVVQAIGAAPAFWLNGLSFVAVIVSLFAVRANQVHRPAQDQGKGNFREGVRFALGQPRVLDLMLLTALITCFGFSNSQILPAFADRVLHGDAGLYGSMMGASGIGALISVLFIVPLGQRVKRTGLMLVAAVTLAGLSFAATSFSHAAWTAMLAYFFSGLPIPLVMTTNGGLIQVLAPGQMRARLVTLYLMLSFGLQPLANLWVGFLAEKVGPALAIRINGFSMFAVAVLMLLRSGLSTWEPAAHRAQGAPQGAPPNGNVAPAAEGRPS